MSASPDEPDSPSSAAEERRSFLAAVATVVLGGIVAIFPFLAGVGVLFDPLRRKRSQAGVPADDGLDRFVRVCPLSALPADGVPHAFPVITDVTDAWTRTTGQRVGMVYLRHIDDDGEPRIVAFTAECPHLGCSVDFNSEQKHFECPCHVSAFALDGAKEAGPSLRSLDPLDAKVVEQHGEPEVWVAFQRFRTGIAERIAIG